MNGFMNARDVMMLAVTKAYDQNNVVSRSHATSCSFVTRPYYHHCPDAQACVTAAPVPLHR